MVAKAAEEDGAQIEWLTRFMFIAEKSGISVLFHDVRSIDTTVASTFSGFKHLTRKLLTKAGVPVPRGLVCRTPEAAIKYWQKLGKPIVVKPKRGTKGFGITVGANSPEEVVAACKRARIRKAPILVEEQVSGTEYRVVVVGGKTLGVLTRDAANVTGDGTSSIEQLVDMKNNVRKQNPHLATRPIKLNRHTVANLERQGLTSDSVIEAGKKVYLRKEANFSAGGDSYDVTDEVPPIVAKVASDAVNAIPGLELAGVDLMYDSDTGSIHVLEVNTDPAISSHHFPMVGKSRDVAGEIWRHSFRVISMREQLRG